MCFQLPWSRLTASESILEDLFKAQELQHRQIDCGVESKTALIWTKRRVELYTISAVDLNFSFIIFPSHTELDDTLWNG